MKPLSKASLIAPCGMNCGICRAYLRKKNHCPGCRGSDVDKPVTRTICKVKTCATLQKGRLKFCVACEEFPCAKMEHLDKRYRTKYGMSMVENLKNIEKYGMRMFLKNEKARWTCVKCGGTVCVHKGCCSRCGEKR